MTLRETLESIFNSLKPIQKTMSQAFLYSDKRKYVIHCSRRAGKSHFLCALAIIFALSKANSQIRYASVTQKSVRKMIHPIFKQIVQNIPHKYRPRFNSQEGAYIFPNGSMIHVAGVNNGQADNLRGTASDLCIVDEAGFVDELSYLVDSVLMPQILTTNGKLIMASSSPLSPAHEFTDYINEAKTNNAYSSYKIYSAGYSKELIEEFCREAGGPQSTTWRREYLNELIVDDQLSIIPEWDSKQFVRETIKDEYYDLYHKYESADWGVRDNTAILFAYYDFRKATLYVENEILLSGHDTTTKKISEEIDKIESTLGWKDVYRRIGDNNELILMQDLGSTYGKYFIPTNKDSLSAMVNEARLFIQAGRLNVSPNCTNLIGCLDYGVFQDTKRNTFGRSKSLGHYDSLAALIYLIRNLDQHTNPISISHNVSSYTHYIPEEQNSNHETLKSLFK